MNQRPNAKSRPEEAPDPCSDALDDARPTILLAYDNFKDLKPIIVYRIREKKILAYAAQEYINDLTERTREETRQVYANAAAAGKFMVFVHDSRKRVLRSYVFPVEESDGSRSENTGS